MMRLIRPSPPVRESVRRTAETLIIGTAGGAALALASLPAGWLSGAIVSVSIAALAGRPVMLPQWLARATFVVMGISLGSAVTPETLASMSTWPASLLFLTIAMTALTAAVTFYLKIVHGWDTGSALLGAFPGALSSTLMLAVETGANVRAVAIVQTVRVAILAVLMPAALAAFGIAGTPIVRTVASPFTHPSELALLIVLPSVAALALFWMRLPGGLIFGAMLAAAVLCGSGVVTVTPPMWLSVAAFVALGSLTGTRFVNTDARLLRHLAAAALGAFAVGTAVAAICALAAAAILNLPTGDTILAYAPGAIDAMMILALALHYDPAFVGAHHLARFMLVLASMPLIVRLVPRRPPGEE
jgi:membrane AbrB-like protein